MKNIIHVVSWLIGVYQAGWVVSFLWAMMSKAFLGEWHYLFVKGGEEGLIYYALSAGITAIWWVFVDSRKSK